MKTVVAIWNWIWFTPTRRYHFGVFRWILVIGYGGWRFMTVDRGMIPTAAGVPPEFIDPVWGARLVDALGLPVPYPSSWVPFLLGGMAVLLVTSAVGILTRVSLLALALLNFYVEAVTSSFGFVDHAANLPSMALFFLVFAPGVKALSVDVLVVNWFRRRRGDPVDRGAFWGRPVAPWPAHLVLVIFVFAYFTAGWSKIRHGGWEWLDGRTLQTYLAVETQKGFSVNPDTGPEDQWRDPYGLESFVYTQVGRPAGELLGQSLLATQALSVFTVLFELAFPVLVLVPGWRPFVLLMGALFHGGIMMTMYLDDFVYYLILYLVFIDWTGMAVTLRRWIEGSSLRRVLSWVPGQQGGLVSGSSEAS